MARFTLPKHARLYRMKLFSDGRVPTPNEVWEAYDAILEMPGCVGYTRRMHSNWATGHQRRRQSSPRGVHAAIIAAKLQVHPFSNIVEVAGWALEANITEAEAFRIVGEVLPEAVKAQARFEHALKLFAL